METNQKKVLLVIPVLVLPFLALGFYALGGGRGKPQVKQNLASHGINTQLPDAAFKTETPQDKLGFYEQNQMDSVGPADHGLKAAADRIGFNPLKPDPQTTEINTKLEALNREISRPVPPVAAFQPAKKEPGQSGPSGMKTDVDRLEGLMQTMRQDKQQDPEMAQLNSMLEKIMAIQNPELVKQKFPQVQQGVPDSLFKATAAVVEGNQKARQGSVVKLRLLDTIRINGQIIPKGHLVYGLAAFSNQRLNLEIRNIRLGTSIIPVNLTVFDQRDAMAGINAPEALLSDAVQSGGSEMMGSVGLNMDPSLPAQIAGAGIDAAKSLFTKRIRRIKQNLKAGYPLLLRNNQLKNK